MSKPNADNAPKPPYLAAEASPGGSQGDAADTRPLNKKPLLIAAIVGVVLFIVLAMALTESKDKASAEEQSDISNDTRSKRSMVTELFGGALPTGIIEKESLSPVTVPKSKDQSFKSKPDHKKPFDGMPASAKENTQIQELKQQFFDKKLKQFESALTAPTTVKFNATTAGTSNSLQSKLVALEAERQMLGTTGQERYQARLAEIQQRSGGGQSGSSALFSAKSSSRAGFEQFGNNATNDRWYLGQKQQVPRTDYEIRAGSVLPATMISGINSDLPGQIMAQISQNVYDTATGHHLLIPQGTRLVGQYSSEVLYGQKRVLVGWQRLVFPDGKALDIGSMPGADGAGYAGFNDQVDNHYVRIFGSAILMSFITAGFEYSQNNNDDDDDDDSGDASDALSEALGQELGITIAKMIQKNLDIAPTLEIRPGYRFNVMVTKDLTFNHAYRQFDY